jgi:tRNA modification GTPase
MTSLHDTVFARASGAGQGAVTILRVSGPGTADVIIRLAGRLPAARLATLRRLCDPASGEVLDHALLLWFPRPGSYTGEDMAELHVHGGGAVLAGVSEALLALGCRPAEPGEFTRRAFLNGKLDLTRAEAIADLVAAETASQRRQALHQASGALARLYEGWTGRATRFLAHQEAAIEFEMDDLPSDLGTQAQVEALRLAAEIKTHLDDGRRGERLREGLSIAIIGAPNAGKSSLLNALVGREAAIVSARAGTTRDVVECRLDLGGVPATLADTAGLRDAVDEIEQEGVRRAKLRAGQSDLLLAVFAADLPPDPGTLRLAMDHDSALLVASKADLTQAPAHIAGRPVLATSAQTGAGLAELKAALASEAAKRAGLGDAPRLTRERHRAALTEAVAQLDEAAAAPLPELAAESYRAAVGALGRLTGRVDVERVLDIVFGDFCIGK